MAVMLFLLFILFFLTSKISCLQFGFLINDQNGLLKKRFVAFGIIADNTSSKVKSEIYDQLNIYINNELYRRSFEEVERRTFLVDPVLLNAMKDGKSMLALKGELSTFQNLFRFSSKSIYPFYAYWKDASFFSDPLLILDFNEISLFTSPFEITLDEPAFMEEDESVYQDLFRKDTSVSQQTEDETPLIQENSKKTFCGCCGCNIT